MTKSYYLTIENNQPPIQHVTKNVHIHKAPTDESIKLLKEYQEKALDSIIDKFTINNNIISANCCVFNDYANYKYICSYIFYINGIRYQNKIEIEVYDTKNRYELVEKIYVDVTHQLLKLMLKDVTFEEGI